MPNTGRSWKVASNSHASLPAFALAVIVCIFVWAELAAIPREAPTVDEQNHLARGLSLLATGDYRLLIGHPPLFNLIAAWPLVFDPRIQLPLADAVWRDADWIEFAISVLWKLDNPALAMMYAGRVMMVLSGALTLAALFRLGADVGGRWAGLLMAALAALDPNLRAHARLITTDLGILLSLTLTLIVWRRWLRQPRPALTVAAGLTLGIALGTKFSALIFAPALLVIALWRWGVRLTTVRRLAVALGLAGLCVWALYRFELRPMTGSTLPLPLANFWEDFLFTTEVVHTPNYLLGQVNPPFDWLYLPIAVLVKTPLPLMAATLLGGAVWLRRRWRAEALLWGPAILYFGVALASGVYIGYRHLFPMTVTAYLCAALGVVWLWGRSLYGRWLAGMAGLWLLVNTALIYPRDLTFFNEIAGGPDRGWRIMVDSNLDWGQDLGELVDFVREQQIESIYVSYFGSIPIGSLPVKEYPLPAKPLPPRPVPDWYPPFPAPGWYAISVSHLVGGAVLDDPDTFSYFRRRQPVAILGRTIYVYYVPPQSGAVAVCADPQPAMDEAQTRAVFGAALTRRLQFDCSRGLPLPVGRVWYVLRASQAEAIAGALHRLGAQLIYGERYAADGLRVYRLDAASLAATKYVEASGEPPTFGGLMSYLGQRRRGAEVQTVWRVAAPLPESISIFLHLTAADGSLLQSGDGFNTPFDQLQPGDGLIQLHPLTGPLPAAGELRTGVYALGGAQARYRLADGRDFVAWPP